MKKLSLVGNKVKWHIFKLSSNSYSTWLPNWRNDWSLINCRMWIVKQCKI